MLLPVTALYSNLDYRHEKTLYKNRKNVDILSHTSVFVFFVSAPFHVQTQSLNTCGLHEREGGGKTVFMCLVPFSA